MKNVNTWLKRISMVFLSSVLGGRSFCIACRIGVDAVAEFSLQKETQAFPQEAPRAVGCTEILCNVLIFHWKFTSTMPKALRVDYVSVVFGLRHYMPPRKMKEFKSLLEDAEKLISYDADDQEALEWKRLAMDELGKARRR
eukprot:s2093_g11.t1